MSLWRPHDECCTCGGLVGYAGERARKHPLRKHLACTCPDEERADLTPKELPNGRWSVAA